MKDKIIPAILQSDLNQLLLQWKAVDGLTDYIQLDVMDDSFIKRRTIRLENIPALLRSSQLEVHLMTNHAEKQLIHAHGLHASRAVCHIESDTDFHEFFSYGHELGMKLGLAINPETDIEKLAKYSEILDYILIMAVNPGQQGQEFLPETYERIKYISERYPGKPIYIDGGVKPEFASKLLESGATGVAMGSAIFSESDPKAFLQTLLSN